MSETRRLRKTNPWYLHPRANFEDDDFAALQGLTLPEIKKVLLKDFVRVPRHRVVAVLETSLTKACYLELLTIFLLSILRTVQWVDSESSPSGLRQSCGMGSPYNISIVNKLAEAISGSCLGVSMDEATSIVVPALAFYDLLP